MYLLFELQVVTKPGVLLVVVFVFLGAFFVTTGMRHFECGGGKSERARQIRHRVPVMSDFDDVIST
jgi:hypothetical protein